MPKMRDSEYVFFILGFVPLIIVFSMFLYIAIARVELGYWPTYGTQPDPSAFGYEPINAIGIIGFIVSPLFIVAWMGALGYGYETYRNNFKINKLSVCCFLSGIALFFVFKYCFPDYFAWYFD